MLFLPLCLYERGSLLSGGNSSSSVSLQKTKYSSLCDLVSISFPSLYSSSVPCEIHFCRKNFVRYRSTILKDLCMRSLVICLYSLEAVIWMLSFFEVHLSN